MPKPNQGGQKSAPALEETPAVPVDALGLISDRIDTPDGLNLAEVSAAVRLAEETRQKNAALRARHMSDCPLVRGKECTCPANLHPLAKVLESITTPRGLEVVRVDDGFISKVKKPDPLSRTSPPITVDVWNEPKWVCTKCGYSYRAISPGDHLCDPSQLQFKEKPLPLAYSIPPERRYNGDFRYLIHRDDQGEYRLSEAVLEGDRIVHQVEVFVDGNYNVFEAALSDHVVESFSDSISPPTEEAA